MDHNLSQHVATEIRVAMARRRVTQAQLGSVLGIAESGVSRRLNGLTPFDLDEVEQVAKHLEVPVASLLPAAAELAR